MPETAPDRRTATGAALRRAILDEARQLLVSDGYANLSMRRIGRGVGCSATSIYLHFENKDGLVHALITEGMGRLLGALTDARAAHRGPVAQLGAMGHAYVRFGLDNPELYEVMFQLRPDQMARYPAEDYRRARRNLEAFAEVFAAGEAAGTLDATPSPDVAAHVLWTALHGLVSLLRAGRVDVRVADDAFVDAAVARAVGAFRAA